MGARFLNVDLDIESASKLDVLANEMGRRVIVLHSGSSGKRTRNLLRLESSRQYKGPDAAIEALCSRVERLSAAGRRLWNSAQKVFNVGYELQPFDFHSGFTLRSKTVKRVGELGATLAVSFYRGDCEMKSGRRQRTVTRPKKK